MLCLQAGEDAAAAQLEAAAAQADAAVAHPLVLSFPQPVGGRQSVVPEEVSRLEVQDLGN